MFQQFSKQDLDLLILHDCHGLVNSYQHHLQVAQGIDEDQKTITDRVVLLALQSETAVIDTLLRFIKEIA